MESGKLRTEYRLTGLLIFLLVQLAGCGEQRPPWAEGAMVRTERPPAPVRQTLEQAPTRLLAIHNRERARLGLPALVWDQALERAAAAYANELTRLGRLAHSAQEQRPGQGENLWMGTRGGYSLEEMAESWVAEKSLFEPGTFPDVSRNGHWQDVAHFTQIIWPETARVGCALSRSREWDFLVCRYSPPGNLVGRRIP